MKPTRNAFARSRRPDKSSRVEEGHDDPLRAAVSFNCSTADSGVSAIVIQSGNETDGYTNAASNFSDLLSTLQSGHTMQAVEKDANYLPEGDEYKVSFSFDGVTYVRKVQRYERKGFRFFSASPLYITVNATDSSEDVTVESIEVESYPPSTLEYGFDHGMSYVTDYENICASGQHLVGSEQATAAIAAAVAALGTTESGDVTDSVSLDTTKLCDWRRLKVLYSVMGCVFSKECLRIPAGGAWQTLVIAPVGFGSPPSDISLSGNQLTGLGASLVGTLSATDSDQNDTAVFSLVDGDGATDNGRFSIAGTSLFASSSQLPVGTYSVRVRVTDSEGLYFEEVFSITVNEPEFSISLSSSSATASLNSSVRVGSFSASRAGVELFTTTDYGEVELVSGEGDTDNGKFTIAFAYGADSIPTRSPRLYLTVFSGTLQNQNGANNFSIRARLTDAYGYQHEEIFGITINPAPSNNGYEGSYGGGSG